MSSVEQQATELSERMIGQSVSILEGASIWLGTRLGWYATLRDQGPATAAELAERAGTQPRYTREWAEQQAVAGILTLTDGRFALPAGHATALLDRDSMLWSEPILRAMLVAVPQLPELRAWLDAGARVADVGCGEGWSAVGLAERYPAITVHGWDVDPVALANARRHATDAGVADRVTFHRADAAGGLGGPYDVVFAIECVHDMPRPVEVLAAIRAAAAPDALVLVVDEATDPVLAAPGDELQRLFYGFSLLICLPDSLSTPDSVATGTVMRPSTLDSYARAAGFGEAIPLEVEGAGLWRFYQLAG